MAPIARKLFIALAALVTLVSTAQAQYAPHPNPWWLAFVGTPGMPCAQDADCNSGFCRERLDESGGVCTKVGAWTDCAPMGSEWAPMTVNVDGQGYLMCLEQPQPPFQAQCADGDCGLGELCDANPDCESGFCYAHPSFEALAPLGTFGICVDYAERRLPRGHVLLNFDHVDPFNLAVPR